MAGLTSETLCHVVGRFPTPPESEAFAAADGLLGGAYGRMAADWQPKLRRLADAYAAGDVGREAVLEHVEAVPSFRLTDGATPLNERRAALVEAADTLEEVSAVAAWYADIRGLLVDDPGDLTLFERALHAFGYVVAHGLFLGASSPPEAVRRLRVAYRLVGVRIDDTDAEPGRERTTFTCPYRHVGADRWGARWICHEKLDRVDDGYVTYLAARGIDYQRPRGCPESVQCYSTVAWDGAELWWPKTPPSAVAGGCPA